MVKGERVLGWEVVRAAVPVAVVAVVVDPASTEPCHRYAMHAPVPVYGAVEAIVVNWMQLPLTMNQPGTVLQNASHGV